MSRRQKRKADIKRRIAGPQDAYDLCRVVGCRRSTMAIKKKGLNRLYCRRHVDHFRRHGSYFKRSYSSSELAPHRAFVDAWLADHGNDERVRRATTDIEALYRRAGPPIEAFPACWKATL